MRQREALMEHLSALGSEGLDAAARSNLSELLYTGVETGVIEHMDSDFALLVYQIVNLAKELGDDFPEELRM